MNDNEFINIINTSESKREILLRYFGYANKTVYDKLNSFIIKNSIDTSHLQKIIKYCPNCGKIIIKNDNKFCNSSCAGTYNNKNRTLSIETKKLISDKLIGRTLSVEHRMKLIGENNGRWKEKIKRIVERKIVIHKESGYIFNDRRNTCLMCEKDLTHKQKIRKNDFCSNSCSSKFRYSKQEERNKNSIVMKKRVNDRLHNGWASRNIVSYPEQFFIKVLNNNNIEFIHNYPVNKKDLGLNDSHNYFLDFYIKDKKIDLEIDGRQHKDRKEHDYLRDKILINNGYIVYRIDWKNINTKIGKEYIKEEINKFLEYYKNL